MNKKELQMAKIKLYYKEFKCYMMKQSWKIKGVSLFNGNKIMICHRCSDDEVFTVVLKLDLKERKGFKVDFYQNKSKWDRTYHKYYINDYIFLINQFKNEIEKERNVKFYDIIVDKNIKGCIEVYTNKTGLNIFKVNSKSYYEFLNGELIYSNSFYNEDEFKILLDIDESMKFGFIDYFQGLLIGVEKRKDISPSVVKKEISQVKEDKMNKLVHEDKLENIIKVVNKRIEDAYNFNIINESNIINTYYIPEVNNGILKYKDLDDDLKEEVFKSILNLFNILTKRIEEQQKDNLIDIKIDLETLNKAMELELGK